jgi:hypothetical protein
MVSQHVGDRVRGLAERRPPLGVLVFHAPATSAPSVWGSARQASRAPPDAPSDDCLHAKQLRRPAETARGGACRLCSRITELLTGHDRH